MRLIKYALATEKSIRLVESQNSLAFIVSRFATKPTIKEEIERVFGVKVLEVRVLNTPQNNKKAYVRFAEDSAALDIATRLGLM